MSNLDSEFLSSQQYKIYDQIFESPQLNSELMMFKEEQSDENIISHRQLSTIPKSKKGISLVKINKIKKIRTERNAQKTYHILLDNWLKQNHYQNYIKKYKAYFNKRIYFILILNEIMKKVNGQHFTKQYQNDALKIIDKKQIQIAKLQVQKQNCEQIQHLQRLIQEINFSIQACNQFVNGNILKAITIVYKRNQPKISKLKQFEMAIKIFKQEFGFLPFDIY